MLHHRHGHARGGSAVAVGIRREFAGGGYRAARDRQRARAEFHAGGSGYRAARKSRDAVVDQRASAVRDVVHCAVLIGAAVRDRQRAIIDYGMIAAIGQRMAVEIESNGNILRDNHVCRDVTSQHHVDAGAHCVIKRVGSVDGRGRGSAVIARHRIYGVVTFAADRGGNFHAAVRLDACLPACLDVIELDALRERAALNESDLVLAVQIAVERRTRKRQARVILGSRYSDVLLIERITFVLSYESAAADIERHATVAAFKISRNAKRDTCEARAT